MGKMMKRIVVAVGLCLFIGLQSLGSVQAAVNYEACPFCGTRVERDTVTNLVGSDYKPECSEHSNCSVYTDIYEQYDVIRCQTTDCPMNHKSNYKRYAIVMHITQ